MHSQEDPYGCPQGLLRPSWAPGTGRWPFSLVSTGSRLSRATLSTFLLTAPRLPSEWGLAPRPDKLGPPSALHPGGFGKEKAVTWQARERNFKHLSGEMSQLRVQLRGLQLPPSQLTPSSGNSIPSRGNSTCKGSEAGKVLASSQEDPLEKEMETHSSILAWRIPWTEEPDRLQSIVSQRVGHD